MDRDFWNEAYRDDPDSVVVVDRILEPELARLQPGRALDLGCGSGVNALKMATQGWSVLGVDWSELAVEIAIRSARQQGLDARFVVADITAWQPDDEFDLVVSTYALPGGATCRQVLQTAAAALAPGGTLIVAEWDRSMAVQWGFEAEELFTPEQIVATLPELEIEAAEARRFEDMFDSLDDPRGQQGSAANVAFVRAVKPQQQPEKEDVS